MSDLKDIQKKASEIIQKQNDLSHQKLPENAVSRTQVDIGLNAGTTTEKLVVANKKDVFEKIDVWNIADETLKQSIVLAWLIQNESYLSIKNASKILEQPVESDVYKNFINIINKFVEATDAKINSTTNIGNKIKTKYFKSDTEINFILNIVAKELGYSVG